MASESFNAGGTSAPGQPFSPGMLIDGLSRFDGPADQFLANLLAVQCRLANATGGAILRPAPDKQVQVLAVHPPLAEGQTPPSWLVQTMEAAGGVMGSGATVVRPLHSADDLYGANAQRHVIMVPLRGGQGVRGVAVYLIESAEKAIVATGRERLELTTSLLSLYEMRLTLQQRQMDLRRLQLAMGALVAVDEQEKFAGAAMAFCNELAARWQCDMVGVGFLKGRYVQLKALSHTEKFTRKMKIVQDIEAAMEECLDQDVEVIHPSGQEDTCVSRAAAELATRHGPLAVLSLPLRKGQEPVAVVTAQRPADRPFGESEIEAMRLTCDLCAPRLDNRFRHDRWVGAKAASGTRSALSWLLGPRQTWLKLAAVGIIAALLFLCFGKGDYLADAEFTLQATVRQVAPAPFDGFLKQVYVEPGDRVVGAGVDEASWKLESDDVAWAALLGAIKQQVDDPQTPSPGVRIWRKLSENAQRIVTDAETGSLDDAGKNALRSELNGILASEDFYAPEAWGAMELGDRARDLLAMQEAGRLDGPRLEELNRAMLHAAFPDAIVAGPTVLASLDTAELRLELGGLQAEKLGSEKRASAAMRENKTAEAQIARAEADKLSTQIRVLEYRIAKANITSQVDGLVTVGDLRRQIGAPVKTGDVLFEVAPLDMLRAEMAMPEDRIADVVTEYRDAIAEGKALRGTLATTGRPGAHVDFEVERIDPVAQVVEKENVFLIRVRLEGNRPWMRPGMEGIGKINLGEKSYIWLWTRRLVNWVRMKLWF
jgi:HlyD family secretion protein/GAF domain-containing protein